MRKALSFTIMFSLGLWVIVAYLQKNLEIYITQRYLYLIIAAAFLSMLLGFIGLLDILWIEFRNKSIKIQNDKKLVLFISLLALGVVVSPFFILIAALSLFFPIESPYLDSFLEKGYLNLVIVVAICFTGIFMPSSPLSFALADQRTGNFNSAVLTSSRSISQNFNTGTKNYNIGDWISSLSYNPDLTFYKDKEVELTGFIYHPENLDNESFLISRFVVRCCAADATPVGLKVNSKWNDKYKEGDWVKVTGKFDIVQINNNDELVIFPESIEPTAIPDRPYLQ